jgi:enoyl-CoA hydratase/carnithine racemase
VIERTTNEAFCTLRLARDEKRNALGRDLVAALVDAIAYAECDPSVRGIVLAAQGGVWAAGGDLDELEAILDAPDGAERVLAIGDALRAIERCDVPVVAAIEGRVLGGGCELALLCDAVFVGERARFSFRHAAMGLSPAWGGGVRLDARIGPLAAARLLMTAEEIEAREAARLGLVNAAVDAGEAEHHAIAFLRRCAIHTRDAVAAQKRSLRAARDARWSEAERVEAEVFRSRWGGDAHRAAMRRFAEGRARARDGRA